MYLVILRYKRFFHFLGGEAAPKNGKKAFERKTEKKRSKYIVHNGLPLFLRRLRLPKKR